MKKNEEFIATFQKDGYIPQQIPVTRQVVGGGVAATAGNIIVGGLVGLGVDAATGAGFEHVPNPVSVILQPDTPPPPPIPAGRSKRPATAAPAAPPTAQPSRS